MCPTVLVLHFTKTHGCYTTYLQIPLGVSLTRCKTSHPQVHQSMFIFHRPSSSQNRLPTFALPLPFHVPTLFSLSGLVSDWHSVSYKKRALFLSGEPSLPLVDHKRNTERKCVGQFGWWCACTCLANPPFASGPLLPLRDVPERSEMSIKLSARVSFHALHPPPSSSCYLWCYSGTTGEDGEGGREPVLSSSFTPPLSHPPFTSGFSFIRTLLLLPHLPLHPGIWWGWVVAGLVVELAVGPRGWVEVYIVAGGLEALQVHVKVTLRGTPSSMNLVLVAGLILVVAAVRWRRILERGVGFWWQALRRYLERRRAQSLQMTTHDWSKSPQVRVRGVLGTMRFLMWHCTLL